MRQPGPGESTVAWWIYSDWRSFYPPAADAIQTVWIFTSWHYLPFSPPQTIVSVIPFYCAAWNKKLILLLCVCVCARARVCVGQCFSSPRLRIQKHTEVARSLGNLKNQAWLLLRQQMWASRVWFTRDYPCPWLIFCLFFFSTFFLIEACLYSFWLWVRLRGMKIVPFFLSCCLVFMLVALLRANPCWFFRHEAPFRAKIWTDF